MGCEKTDLQEVLEPGSDLEDEPSTRTNLAGGMSGASTVGRASSIASKTTPHGNVVKNEQILKAQLLTHDS